MFLLPGQATREEIIALVARNLSDICSRAVARESNVYWMTMSGLADYEKRLARRASRRPR